MKAVQSAVGLPNDPVFIHLAHAARNANKVIIRDPVQNLQADHVQFLQDILQFRSQISSVLPGDMVDEKGMIKNDHVYILLSAASSYQFLVALFAILAVGGAAVLLPPDIPAEEVISLAGKCNAVAAAFVPENQPLIDTTRVIARESWKRDILPISIALNTHGNSIDMPLTIEDNISFSVDRPALVQFTSGLTGPPKAVMHPRKFFHHQVEVYFGHPMSEANGLEDMLGPDPVYLSYRSFHWGGGIRNATAAILAGVTTEIYNHDATSEGIWERLRKGDVKLFICWASMWTQMKQHYEDHLVGLPESVLKEYTDGIRNLRVAKSDSNPLPPAVKQFWRGLLGVAIGVNYAAAEMSISMGKSALEDEEIGQRSIGLPLHGVTVKLSEGDTGEILIKSPLIFSAYLGEEERTRAAFDEEGYYKTGDLGHFDGNKYTIDGRISQNFIVFNGSRVSTMEVEEKLMALPYIAEAYVVGVPDAEFINRTGVLIRVKEVQQPPSLEVLRRDLAAELPEHKLPTLSRILEADDVLPKTHSGKTDLRKASSEFFPQSVEGELKDLPTRVEVWKIQ